MPKNFNYRWMWFHFSMDESNLINIAKIIFFQPKKFFFENLGIKQTIFKNTLWLALSEGLSIFLKLILLIYVARILGPTDYGKFTFALAFVNLFIVFTDFALSQITIREFSRNKEKEKEFSALLSLKILFGLGTLFLILIGSFFITPDPLIQKLIWILAIFIIIESFLAIFFAFFQAQQKMEYQAWMKILEAMILAGAGFYILFYFPSVLNLSLGYLFSAFIALIFLLIFFHFKGFPLKLTFQKSIWKNYLKLSWPLALAGFLGSIHTNFDSAMMGYFGQIVQTGWYNAAYKIIGVSLIPAGLISISFFPVLNKLFAESRERVQKVWDYYLESMIFLALPILVGGIALALKIIDLVYDPNYFPSIFAFQILLGTAAITMISFPFSQILIVFNQQKKLLLVALFGTIINVILNFILIPKFSLYGAAIAFLVSVSLSSFLLFKFTQKFTTIKPFNLRLFSSFIGIGLSALPMYFVVIQPQIFRLNVLITILIGAAIYLICFLMYKGILSIYVRRKKRKIS